MQDPVFYTAGRSRAISFAETFLKEKSFSFTKTPSDRITHLLLDVPSFQDNGILKSGECLSDILASLPNTVTVIGGNLNHPVLQQHRSFDLLKDPDYLAENAMITAYGAIKECISHLPITLADCPVLVIGWGRIGKCLVKLLQKNGANVTVASRSQENRAIIRVLGCDAIDSNNIGYELLRFRVIFNTADGQIISKSQLENCRSDCLKIDLASKKGIDAQDVIWARGLPNLHAPESSGKLIAKIILRFLQSERSIS